MQTSLIKTLGPRWSRKVNKYIPWAISVLYYAREKGFGKGNSPKNVQETEWNVRCTES